MLRFKEFTPPLPLGKSHAMEESNQIELSSSNFVLSNKKLVKLFYYIFYINTTKIYFLNSNFSLGKKNKNEERRGGGGKAFT